ncbi:Putative AC transposase OS=Zea mays PE=2 SV=2 [Sparassis crispa]|uniref:Putative AC transposase n=1 Tax=Sparassis crispa TaxID=139825 RepID=A0A401H668_9APHY|nr:Putative AC transposase OS=Zea mays PE=2 SV=2 [Sparassis crispa]GBE89936.1 Putative AC transposase OS=Zea mays PE=2 SV=2 [Sparassis crispa]
MSPRCVHDIIAKSSPSHHIPYLSLVQEAGILFLFVIVTNSTSVQDIICLLKRRCLVPADQTSLYLYAAVPHTRWLRLHERLGELGLGPMSHVHVRIRVLGGSNPSSSPSPSREPHTPSPRPSTALSPSSDDSPAKNTRARTGLARTSSPSAVVIVSPPKQRKRKSHTSSDLEVWDMPDDEIIALVRSAWKSNAYDHYNITLERNFTKDGKADHLLFCFKCKYDPANHRTQYRERSKTSQGTKNLDRSTKACFKRRGVGPSDDPHAGAQQTLMNTISRYSERAHRAIVALRCAASRRPFHSVADPYYLEEVELLRPGTKVPTPHMVSQDVQQIYQEGSKFIKEYFSKLDGAIHLVIDGWTAPFVASYLGIVVIWFDGDKLWRSILEFVRLTERHTGLYLAQKVADCVKRFGLQKKLHTLCMDNASNCDATATELEPLVDSFRGAMSRTHCFPHTVNLIAKAFISFFFRQPKKKKVVKVAAGSKRKRRGAGARQQASAPEAPPPGEPETQEVVLDYGDPLHIIDETVDGTHEDDDISALDDGKAAHDEAAVSSVHAQAIRIAREDYHITMTAQEESDAQSLFTKVAGLARHLHDSPTLQEKFEKLVDAQADLVGSKKALDRRVATRWNSDFACLNAHIHFETPVRQLTSDLKNELQGYALTREQWSLAKQLGPVLEIFQDLTDLFSQAEVPLIHETVPMLEQLEHQLTAVRDDVDMELPSVICIAAQASLLVVGKYYALTDDTDVYRIAIAMCPDKKLEWFNKNPDWRAEDHTEAAHILRARWTESYAGDSNDMSVNTPTVSVMASTSKRGKWASSFRNEPSTSTHPIDSIDAYLESPLVSRDDVKQAGGVLAYWAQASKTRPRLARMALDFLTAPASSVDAERAFSGGRLTVNHLQHQTSSQSFKAQVAVGSWAGTPLLQDTKTCASFIGGKKRSTSAKGKEREVMDVDL